MQRIAMNARAATRQTEAARIGLLSQLLAAKYELATKRGE